MVSGTLSEPDTYLIDRIPELGFFRGIMTKHRRERVLRITGVPKMGKTRLIEEYQRIAKREFGARCALIDFRGWSQSDAALLYTIGEQIDISFFPELIAAQEKIATSPNIELSGIHAFSHLSIQSGVDPDKSEHQRGMLTYAFLKDLRAISGLTIVILFDTFEASSDSTRGWLNEQLLVSIKQIPHVVTVLAGKALPTPLVSWKDMAQDFELEPVKDIEEYKQYCAHLGMELDEKTCASIETLYTVFEGSPGLFADYVPKLASSV